MEHETGNMHMEHESDNNADAVTNFCTLLQVIYRGDITLLYYLVLWSFWALRFSIYLAVRFRPNGPTSYCCEAKSVKVAMVREI